MNSIARWVWVRAFVSLVAGLVMTLGAAVADDDDDAFIVGYATAILERDFSLSKDGFALHVHQGTITMNAGSIPERDRDRVVAALSRIRGVRQVVMLDGAPRPPVSPDVLPFTGGGGWSLFPEERLFAPLLADPRWPHFSISAIRLRRSGPPEVTNLAAISLGEEFNFASWESPSVGKFSIGLQPAVFSIFNLDTYSRDLVNADYRVSIPVDYRTGLFSAQLRGSHQSSHLGDEFLIATPIDRLDLSYETVDLLLSADLGAFRIYGGGGRIVHSQIDLEPWSAQQGVEYVSPNPILNDSVRPVVALDLQEHEKTDWELDLSFRTGVEFASPEKGRARVQLLFEYYRGHNPNGQFYEERAEFFGMGLHVYF